MEVCKDDQSIRFEFQTDDILYVEWCDGQVRGVREIHVLGYRNKVRQMMEQVFAEEGACGRSCAQGDSLYVEAVRGNNYLIVELAYVPEEDLQPWQWICVKDYFRPEEYRALLDSI